MALYKQAYIVYIIPSPAEMRKGREREHHSIFKSFNLKINKS